jgi:Family of unknown function (DUF5908)
MPIEIKELVIKLTVTNQNTTPKPTINFNEISSQIKKEIIEECVERVLEILDEKNER